MVDAKATAKIWRQSKRLWADEWVRMLDVHAYIHAHSGILFGHKEGNPAICDSLDGPRGRVLSGIVR